MRKLVVCLLLSCACAFPQGDRDSRIASILSDLSATNTFPEVAMSPDGKRAAWVAEIIENGKDTGNSAIYVKDLASGSDSKNSPVRITAGAGGKAAHSERNIAWSPDSKQIAFFSDAEKKKQMQVYVEAAAGGKARKLTNLKGFMTDPQWSPDGSRIAILFAENAPGGGGPLEAEPVETGVIGGEIHNQRLTIVDVATGARQADVARRSERLRIRLVARRQHIRRSAPRPVRATTTGGSRSSTPCPPIPAK